MLGKYACLCSDAQASRSEIDKGIYGAISELFYASAQQRQQAKTCTNPPKDLTTDYAKDLVGKTDIVAPKPDEISCTTAFSRRYAAPIWFSYIYLMYDILNPNRRQSTTVTIVLSAKTTRYPNSGFITLPSMR